MISLRKPTTIDEVFNDLYKKGSKYDDILTKFLGYNDKAKREVLSEISITWLNRKRKIIEMYDKDELKYYLSRTLTFQIKSNTSNLYTNTKHTIASDSSDNIIDSIEMYSHYNETNNMIISEYTQPNDDTGIEKKIYIEEKYKEINHIMKRLKSKTWFTEQMFLEYFFRTTSEKITYRDIGKKYNFSHKNVYNAVKKMKKMIYEFVYFSNSTIFKIETDKYIKFFSYEPPIINLSSLENLKSWI